MHMYDRPTLQMERVRHHEVTCPRSCLNPFGVSPFTVAPEPAPLATKPRHLSTGAKVKHIKIIMHTRLFSNMYFFNVAASKHEPCKHRTVRQQPSLPTVYNSKQHFNLKNHILAFALLI